MINAYTDSVFQPDMTKRLIKRLQSDMTLTNDQIGTKAPAKAVVGEYIRVSLVNANQISPRHFQVLTLIECFSDREATASSRAIQTAQAVKNITGDTMSKATVTLAKATNMVSFPDGVVNSARIQFTADLTVLGVSSIEDI